MQILHLSDTHGQHRQLTHLPMADVIVHSGDFCHKGTEDEVVDFIEWLASLPHKYKIFVGGNHDDLLCGASIDGLPDDVFYLCYSSVKIEGVNFYGLPMFVEDDISGLYFREIGRIPQDTDVLITHQPPYGVLDLAEGNHYGSSELLEQVQKLKVKLHLFGHVHKASGTVRHGGTTYANSSIITNQTITFKPRLLRIT